MISPGPWDAAGSPAHLAALGGQAGLRLIHGLRVKIPGLQGEVRQLGAFVEGAGPDVNDFPLPL